MAAYIQLLRIDQYIKNLFIFAPIFFALEISNTDLIFRGFIAFIGFSLCASAVYIFNDYQDIQDDRLHPEKKSRPLASAQISIQHAFTLLAILLIFGLSLTFWLSNTAGWVLLAYIFSNVLYSLKLKHVAIVDVSQIALGFIFRIFIGSIVTDIPLSEWIVILTFLLALFLALAKRRDDVLIYERTGKKMRKVIDGYNLAFLDNAMSVMSAVVIVAYLIYITSSDLAQKANTEYLYITAVFVILGVLRYLQITLVEENSSSPTRIVLKDAFMQVCIVCWLLTFAWLLYF